MSSIAQGGVQVYRLKPVSGAGKNNESDDKTKKMKNKKMKNKKIKTKKTSIAVRPKFTWRAKLNQARLRKMGLTKSSNLSSKQQQQQQKRYKKAQDFLNYPYTGGFTSQ